MRRRICVVTGSRAEYGLLYWLMREIMSDPKLELQVVVTGMHLSPAFGLTVSEIERDGMPIVARVEMQLSSDTSVGMTKSLGLGLLGFADAFDRLRPDLVVVLGDRYEILAASLAAALQGIPIGHVCGGEVTSGAVDDWIRHSITKAAWLHFVGAESYRSRVIQLGEDPDRVFNVGGPGLDSIRRLQLLSLDALSNYLGLSLDKPLFLVTYHPATLGDIDPRFAFQEVLYALEAFPDAKVVMTKPNADAGGYKLGDMAEDWCSANEARARCVTSMGQLRYLSLMKYCNVVVGNSSSGIIEAPALKVATVNIGSRQEGRLKADSIIDCADDRYAIQAAIAKAMDSGFKHRLRDSKSLYGDCNASTRIKAILSSIQLPSNLAKKFYDL